MQLNNYSLKLYKIKNYFTKPLLKLFFIEHKAIKNYNVSLSSFLLFSNSTLKQFFNMTVYKNLNVIITSYINHTYYNAVSLKNIMVQKKNINIIFDLKYYSKFQLYKIKSINHIQNIKNLYLSLKKLFNYRLLQIIFHRFI